MKTAETVFRVLEGFQWNRFQYNHILSSSTRDQLMCTQQSHKSSPWFYEHSFFCIWFIWLDMSKTVNEGLCSFIFIPFKNDIIFARGTNSACCKKCAKKECYSCKNSSTWECSSKSLVNTSLPYIHLPSVCRRSYSCQLAFSEPSTQQLLNHWSCPWYMLQSASFVSCQLI